MTAPIFLWILCGAIFKSVGLINDRWVGLFSNLVFYVSLPMLMFFSVVRKPLGEVFELGLTLICVAVTLIVYGLSVAWARQASLAPEDATVFQQGALRGNLGIIGISLCLNAYGNDVLVTVSILMALLTIVYNLLSVFVFVDGLNEGRLSKTVLLRSLGKNPLIVAILLGFPLAIIGIEVPGGVLDFSDRFVALTLPLALISIGASLSFRSVKADFQPLAKVAVLKLLVAPLLGGMACLFLGYRGESLGVVFLLLASPAATASFIMAKAYGANHVLAANVVVFTTLLSLLTISGGVFLLTFLELM
ncbi:MAG: AEC family transporter [Cellvibrionaceae bacterium]